MLTSMITAQETKNPVVVMKTSHGDISIEMLEKSAPETVKNFIGLAEGTKEFTNAAGEKVKKPFYDGLIFHRVIDDFMIQGGRPSEPGNRGPGYAFKNEINANSLGLDKMKAFDENKKPHEYLVVYPQQKIQKMLIQPITKRLKITTKEELDARQEELKAELDKSMENLTIKQLYENSGYSYDDTLTSHPMKRGYLAMANAGPGTNGSQFYINLKDNRYLDGKHTVFGKVIEGMDIADKIGKVETGSRDAPLEPIKIISIRLKK